MVNIDEMKSFMYDVIGAIHEVHHELGPGLKEVCYQEGLAIELDERHIPFTREFNFHPLYHGKTMKSSFRLDFLCKQNIIVECKSVSELDNASRAQLFNYMRILKKSCGILVNFAPSFAVIERYLYDKDLNRILTVGGKVLNNL